MKYKILNSTFIFLFISLILIFPIIVKAQYSNICNDPDVSQEDLKDCEEEYNECKENPSTLPESNLDKYNECIGNEGCNSIVRYTSFDTPADCIGWEERVTPGTYAYDWYDEIKKYCDCIDNCNEQYYVQRDCEEVLSDCCSLATMEGEKITISEDLEVVIKRIEGDVEVQIDGGEYRKAKVGDKLHMGDYIATGFESTCTVIFEKVAEMDIKEMTNFAIAQFYVQGNLAKTAISLRMGEVTTHVYTGKESRASFEIESPTSTAGVRGTKFKVRYNEQSGISEYFVYEGLLEVTDNNEQKLTELKAREYVYVDEEGYVSEILEIPEYEELTEEEITLFEEYEQDSYEFESLGSDEEVTNNNEDNITDYSIVYYICAGLICLSGLVGLIFIAFIIIRKKKK